MKQKLSVAEFALLVGTTSKTVYERLKKNAELPVIEQLQTVNEKVKGREVTLILTDSDQINLYKEIYGKNIVNDGEYYEFVTENNGLKQLNEVKENVKNNIDSSFASEMFDKLKNLNEDYNNRIERLNNELITYKSKVPLLEDKASREGIYINEINDLKKEINRKNMFNKILLTVLTVLLIVITAFMTWFITVNHSVNNAVPSLQSQYDSIENLQ